jgi:hypothetical protein
MAEDTRVQIDRVEDADAVYSRTILSKSPLCAIRPVFVVLRR